MLSNKFSKSLSFVLKGLDGEVYDIEFEEEDILLEAVQDAGIDIIKSPCAGGISCGQCQVYVPMEHMEDMEDDEKAALRRAYQPKENSRLACAIELDESWDGAVVEVAPYKTRRR